jgi:tetratricopeptide (TPR) repeat protein
MTDNNEQQQLQRAVAEADASPQDVELQIEAAYSCDRYGDEADAVRYYDAAWKLGVPAAHRRKFLVGYGSTLRNVGRVDESIEILLGAIAEFPGFAPLTSFLSLSLYSAGRHREAMTAALSAILEAAADSGSLDRYDRALRYYRDELKAG